MRSPLAAAGVAEALTRILHLVPGELRGPAPGHPDPSAHYRGWLGGRGLGLVPVDRPAAFSWAGPWLAIVERPGAGAGPGAGEGPALDGSELVAAAAGDEPALVAAVAFGVPPGLLWLEGVGELHRADGPAHGRLLDSAVAGFVVAPLVMADWVQPERAVPSAAGEVVGLAIAPTATGHVACVDAVIAEAGLGLVGDRYHAQTGTFSTPGATGTAVTLVDADELAAIPPPAGPIDLAASRRNIATRGIDLDALIGREFLVGEVRCFGRRRAEPCAHLERLAGTGTLRALIHRAGLRADILDGGRIALGDAVRVV